MNPQEEEYNKSLNTLSKYPNMLQNFKSDDVSFIVLDSDEIDLIFDIAISFYTALYYEKKKEEKDAGIADLANEITMGAISTAGSIVSVIPGGQLIGSIISGVATALKTMIDIIITKTRKYPPRINDLPKLISMFITWAKISPKNQNIIMDGTYHYIEMQKEELNDFVKEYEAGYVELDSFMLFYIAKNLLPQYKEMVKKAMKTGGEQTYAQIPDIYPQGSGKDNTNEIDFAKEPIKDTQEEKERRTSESKSDGAILDFMRHRQSAEFAGGNKYDYEYSKVGFSIKLEKARIISPLKQFAKNAMVTQVVKEFVLTLCSMHFAKRYLALLEYNDLLIVEKHRVTDMVEEEINPTLIKFNAQSKYETLKAQHERYNNGYRPTITHQVLLDLKDESIEKYYTQYNTLYAQLSDEAKKKFGFIIMDADSSLTLKHSITSYYDVYVHDEDYIYKDYLNLYKKDIQFKKPIESNQIPQDLQEHYKKIEKLFTLSFYLENNTESNQELIQDYTNIIQPQMKNNLDSMKLLAVMRYLIHAFNYKPISRVIGGNLAHNYKYFIAFRNDEFGTQKRMYYAIQASEEFKSKYFIYNLDSYSFKQLDTIEYKGYEILQAYMTKQDNPQRYERITNEEAQDNNISFKPYVMRMYHEFTFTKPIDKTKLQDKIAEVMIQLQEELKEIPKDKHNFDKLIQSGVL